jgi:hypothetical protein
LEAETAAAAGERVAPSTCTNVGDGLIGRLILNASKFLGCGRILILNF